MQYLFILIIAALTFGVCYAFDKGFVALFRNKIQHRSGKAVRVHKRYASIGLILFVLGLAGVFHGETLYVVSGIVVLLLGAGLITYYMTFGVFYDNDGFVLLTFGKPQKTYYYKDIVAQQLLNASGNLVIELYLQDGNAVTLQHQMEGVYDFLDAAFYAWCRQNGKTPEDCPHYDPANSCWFPPA